MALRSLRERGLQMFPARSPGRSGGPTFCPCVWGATSPPPPAALIQRNPTSKRPCPQTAGLQDPSSLPPRQEARDPKRPCRPTEPW
uniref:Uncharacterized protein n=1 Tax=Mustela putorius furo TaxID=9669 RepID=M3XYA9_MUSPF